MNFGGLPAELSSYATASVAVLPVPYEATTTYRPGARNGPAAILEASEEVELYDPDLDALAPTYDPSAAGIATLPPLAPHLGSPEQMVERVRAAVVGVLADGKLPLVLGGEHTLTLGAVDACRQHYHNLSVLQLDAHADLRDEYLGARLGHATVMRRVLDLGLAVVAVGVRSLSQEEGALIRDRRLPVFWARDIVAGRYGRAGSRSIQAVADEVAVALRDDVYVTVDLDVFDPAVVAAVGTPEPGGLDWYEVTTLLATVARRRRVVAADVVELAPSEGPVAGAFAAAKLAYKLAGWMLAGLRRRGDANTLRHRDR